MSIFSAGEIVSADEMNRDFMIAAPDGAVIAFHLGGGVNVTWGRTGMRGAEQTGEPVTHGVFSGPRVTEETRPVNVALIYCMRKSQ